MKKYIYFLLFIMLSFGTAYADNKKDLFDDYGIYTKEMDEQIITVKKEVYTEIYNIKKLMLENNQKSVNEKLNIIRSKIQQLDNYIKDSSKTLKTENMKQALTYPVYELSFYEKEIKEIEKKYKDEETAVKKQAEIIRNDFFKAVFE